jgi:hypothetical protein
MNHHIKEFSYLYGIKNKKPKQIESSSPPHFPLTSKAHFNS